MINDKKLREDIDLILNKGILTLFFNTFLLILIICTQSITCFADVPCTGCCLISGSYDGIAANGSYYKDRGGLRQYQVLGNSGGTCSGSCRPYEDAKGLLIWCANNQLDYVHSMGDCIPCLTLPDYGPRNWPHYVGTAYGGMGAEYCSEGKYAPYATAYWLVKSVACMDDSIDTDEDGVADCSDNCPWIPNPTQSDCDGDGKGDACDCDINLSPSKSNIMHGQQAVIQTKGCGNISWTVTSDDGVVVQTTQSANSVTISALSGQGNVTIKAQSIDDPDCKKSTTIHVGCNPCAGGACQNIKLKP